MTPAAGKIALLYDDDGYKEVLGQPLKDASGTRTGLIGRQVAGKEFLDAYLSHGSWTELVALVRNQASAQSILRLCESHPSSQTRRRGLRVIEERRFHQAFFPTPPANLLYNPCPPDLRYAWARQHKGPGSFALSGVTHTLCSQRALEWLGDLVTAPFESYDSLICTSQAVVDMVRAVTTSYADYLRDRHGGNPRARIRLEKIPLGVNTELFRPPTTQERAAQRRAFRIEADEVAVLFVGRLSHHGKAHPFPMYHGLAQAARRAGRKVHLILSGWAPNQAVQKAFEDGARTFAAGIRVSFLDGTDPAQRYAVWQAADLFTSLSDNIQETFGLVIVEAMASGLPVVASDWNGYRDLVINGETGLLVPTTMIKDATADVTSRLQLEEINYDHFLAETSQCIAVDCAAAAEAYTRLLGDASLRRQLGLAGRLRAEQLFAWPHIIRAYETLWQDQERERLAVVALAHSVAQAGRSVFREGEAPAEPPSCAVTPPMAQTVGRIKEEFWNSADEPARQEPRPPESPHLALGTRYPPPEQAFAGYPSRWLSDTDHVQKVLEANERLDGLLAMPLVTHVADSRCADASILRSLLAAAAFPSPLRQLQDMLMQAGVAESAARATLAWMLKYDLLRAAPT
jgi:glycosyltransferase involved in cell wall biosynthesis